MPRQKKEKTGDKVVVDFSRPYNQVKALEVGKAFLDGKDVSGRLNGAMLTENQWAQAQEAQKSDDKAPVINRYCPVVVDVTLSLAKVHPVECLVTDRKGKVKKSPICRRNHLEDVRKNITEGSLVKVGSYEFIAGAKIDDAWVPAIHCIHANKSGGNGFASRITHQLSFENVTTVDGDSVTKTELNNLVGRINNSPRVITLEDGSELAVLPNQVVEWGHLVKDGKSLTPAQIHGLKDNKGVSFQALKKGLIGRGITPSEFCKGMKHVMSLASTKDESGQTAWDRMGEDEGDKVWYNASNTQCRVAPSSSTCFGLRHGMIGMPMGMRFNADGSEEELFVCIGRFLPIGLTETVHQANRRLAALEESSEETETQAETAAAPAETKKSSKKGTKKQTKTKSSGKKSKTKTKKSSGKKSKEETVPETTPVEETVPEEESAPVETTAETTAETEEEEITDDEILAAESDALASAEVDGED